MPPTPGLLYVTSRLLPSSPLTPSAFTTWYETAHAPAVLALPGIPSATLYEALPPPTSRATQETEDEKRLQGPPQYLITYSLPCLSYLSSPAFQALASSPAPGEDVIYSGSAFDIRTYAFQPATAAENPTASHVLASFPVPRAAAEVEGRLKQVDGFLGYRVLELKSRVLRVGGVVSVPEGEDEALVVAWFERVEARGAVEKLFADECVRWWGVRRVWDEGPSVHAP